ncbi:lipid IV(A) 3-deoxy-D-manno-octulosonic acid transferase [Simiduia agarivorans]|uniref:3-deoxy-D-manno-octulosonic acid transferase n=1 Tax=Simiduia agarivorans (strain DSM 21679 / JCM 13881 / BCRC 17597 / SA1) TaxID=1117647 RepID=K4KJT3_SIMAS|nr:lipid IV(A) 3-deoxy-D-manno-octulosonic acid transferase [Simiduia agarivorans]AFU99414.1 3-deoxy-D-manno-octulosonic-acid transferase [Simiduia agarivorans SA1 = DSM 21679]
MARLLYTLTLYLALPFIALRLLWRARKAPAYARRWSERFAAGGALPTEPCIWVHAVSVGETLAALDMIRRLQAEYPDKPLLVTTTTPTGSERVRAALGDSVHHVYLPYDLPDHWWRFFRRLRPRVLIVMETELWPNLVAAASRRHIPVLLANARLSARSARGYARFSALTRPMLQRLACVAAQQQADADRFVALGLPASRLRVTGSIKFDLHLPEALRAQAQALHQAWVPADGKLWLAASTHEGEDAICLAAHRLASGQIPGLRLLLVPRHPERFGKVTSLAAEQGFRTVRRSEYGGGDFEVMVGDTMGELLAFYGACDFAFVGGSLVPRGGHNMIEPAAWARPVISGPHLFNFSEVARLLEQAQALTLAENSEQLAEVLVSWCEQPALAMQKGQAALQVADANRGALDRLLAEIKRLLAG